MTYFMTRSNLTPDVLVRENSRLFRSYRRLCCETCINRPKLQKVKFLPPHAWGYSTFPHGLYTYKVTVQKDFLNMHQLAIVAKRFI